MTGGRTDPCSAARDGLVLEGPNEERVSRHLASCAACRSHARQLDEIRTAVHATSARGLDDVARMRIQTRLALEVDRMVSERATRTARWRWPLAAAASAAALALVVGLVVGRRGWRRAAEPPAVLELIVPYGVSAVGLEDPAAGVRLGVGRRVLEVPAASTVRAAVGRAGQISVVGPARLTVARATAQRLELRLDRGLLLAQVEHVEGRSFHVAAPGADVTVVGTVFSVDARDARVRVSVSRGAVVARSARVLVALSAGQSWRAGDRAPGVIARELAAQLASHEAGLSLPRGAAGILVLHGSPASSRASLGRTPLGETPLAVLLPPGVASVELTAPGYAPTTIRLTVQAGQATRIGFALSTQPRLVLTQPRLVLTQKRATTQPVVVRAVAPGSGAARQTAETLYSWAEAALREGDEVRARRVLRELLRRFPRDATAAAARYELARLAHKAGDAEEARLQLKTLVRLGEPTFRDPARFLLCRIAAEAKREGEAIACLAAFRRELPSSAHDQEALYLLAQLSELRAGCSAARPLFDEYLRRYPKGAFARAARERSRRCAP